MTDVEYNELYERVRSFAGDNARDILHDALEVALTHQCVDFPAYVMRVAFNLWKEQPHRCEIPLEGIMVADDDRDDEIITDVYSALDRTKCSWWEKEYFKRKVLEGKTNEEMASEIGIDRRQGEYSYNKVKKRLRKILKDGR